MGLRRACRKREGHMLYIRVSLMVPKEGFDGEVAQLMDDLVAFYDEQPGYIRGYKLRSSDGNAFIGRVTVWESEASADAAAQTTHVLSRRAELQPLIEQESHLERSFDAAEGAQSLAELVAATA
jgi:quinol monooxygenase YgiN